MKVVIILLLMVLPFCILPIFLLLKDRDCNHLVATGTLLSLAGFVWAMVVALVANL